MRISSKENGVYHSNDVINKIDQLEKEYRNVYWTHIEGDLYVYRPIGRKEYKDIALDETLDTADKKDKIVQTCVLMPEDFNVDECIAGIPEMLYEQIIINSYLESNDTINGVLNYYRNEMFSLDNQITCIINEAFPQFDIEEIENWGVEQTAKYLSRAEWKLQNFRNFQFNEEYFNAMEEANKEEEVKEVPKEEPKDNKQNGKQKEKLTPEKLAKLKAQFPEINWEADSVMSDGIEGMRDSVDTLAPALRTGMW